VVYYLHGDHLGSTSLTTDQNQNIVSEVRYLPYGQERWTNGATPTDFTFTGQRAEAGFGLMDYNARYYNPRLGQFVSPDTVVPEEENPQHWNRYSYVSNNPLKYTDPNGHEPYDNGNWGDCQKPKPPSSLTPPEDDEEPLPEWRENVATYASYGAVGLDALAVVYSGMQAVALDTVGLIVIGAGFAGGGPVGAASGAGLMVEADFLLAGYTPAALPEIGMGVGSAGLTIASDFLTNKNHFTNDGIVLTQDSIAATRNAIAGIAAPEVHLDAAINVSQLAYDIERLTGNREAVSTEIKLSDFTSASDYLSKTREASKTIYYECSWVGLCD
jgi:RHS repeat-associated protein